MNPVQPTICSHTCNLATQRAPTYTCVHGSIEQAMISTA